MIHNKTTNIFLSLSALIRKRIGSSLIQEYSKSMERRLIEVADKGDVDELHNLIKEYPLLLKAAALAGGETPLHIACMGGHVNFVGEILNLSPEFANELNQEGVTPLHIASAKGHTEIVKELLKVGSHLCLVKGKEKRIPLHYAVAKGRIQVIRELVSACLDSITQVTARGETCFHLAVKNNQFEALEVLCQHVVAFHKQDILFKKDEQGNNILHLAASRKQYEVVDLLLDKNFGYMGNLEVNSSNKKGLTPLDVLVFEGGDCEIEEMLTLAAGGAITGEMSPQNSVVATQSHNQSAAQEQRGDRPKSAYNKLLDYFKFDRSKDSLSEVRNALLVTAVLIATVTYQAVLTPPGGVWQDDTWPIAKNNTSNNISSSTKKQPPPHTAGKAVMATHTPKSYGLYLIFNSLGLFASLQMMPLLILGFPLQFELTVACFAIGVTYAACVAAITPTDMLFMFLLVFLLPIMMPILSKVVRDYKKGRGSAFPTHKGKC